MNKIWRIGCLGLLVACQAPATIPPGATQLTAAELRGLFTNVTMSGTSITTGNKFSSYYAPDGSVTTLAGAGFRDTGKYRIEDDGRMCTQMQGFRAGQNVCATFYKDGPKIFRSEVGGGVVEMKTDFRPGNPDKL